RPVVDRIVSEPAAVVRDEGRADLDDDTPGLSGELRHRQSPSGRPSCTTAGSSAASASTRGSSGPAAGRIVSSRSAIARVSSTQPSPLIAETANTGPCAAYLRTNASIRFLRSVFGIRSSLFNTSQRGLADSAGSYLSSSRTIARASRTGSASGSN